MRVPLSLACGAYDRTAALARGDIRPEGVDLTLLAFEQARREAAARLAETAAGASLLPWAYADAERTRDVMGADFWAYGLAGNEDTLRTFVRYSFEQGLISRPREAAELFAPETREAYVI